MVAQLARPKLRRRRRAVDERSGDFTFANFLELVRDDQKADLINGVIYMASPETIEHNDLENWLSTILREFLDYTELGRVTVSRVAYRLGAKEGPEPDVAIVLSRNVNKMKKGYVAGRPELVIEIVSPDSVDRDYNKKRRQYERAGVPEYWILDPEMERVTFLRNGPRGFVEVKPKGHIVRSRVLPGFWLDVRWLLERPLPKTFYVLQLLLEGR